MNPKIDMIKLYQEQHPAVIGEVFRSSDTGKIIIYPEHIEGLSGSGATCRAGHDKPLELRVNPSKWNNSTSVPQGRDHQESIDLVYKLAERFGAQLDGTEKITRLDVCQDFVLGNEQRMNRFIDDARRKVLARQIVPVNYEFGLKVFSGNRRFRIYDKGREIKHYLKKNSKKLLKHTRQELRELSAWCIENGVVRFETEYKSVWLSQKGWNTAQDCYSEIVEGFKKEVEEFMPKEIDASAELIAELPKPARLAFFEWLEGMDWSSDLKKTQVYHYRKLVKDKLGVDMRDKPPRRMNRIQKVVRPIPLEESGLIPPVGNGLSSVK